MPKQNSGFEIHLGEAPQAASVERATDGPFRIAIVGDFSGRAFRATGAGGAARNRARRVDRDEVDEAIAAFAPALHLQLDPEIAPVAISFAELEDFHPDRLAERLPVFQSLLTARRDASSGAVRPGGGVGRSRADAPARGLLEGGLLDMVLDATPNVAPPGARGAPADELSDFVRQAVRPHTVAQPAAEQEQLVAKLDAVLEATMRVVLHHPAFQALESLWRGVDFFVRRLDTDADLQVFLVDALPADGLAGLSGDWSLVVLDTMIGPDALDRAAALAAAGRAVGAPVIAGAAPQLAGTASFAHGADADDWTRELPEGWDALRGSANAPYLALALPRLFLRLPYGKATDSCAFMRFEEIDAGDAEAHESYLWGNGALACALIAATGVQDDGEAATHGTIDRLPLHVETLNGEARSVPCAEAVLTTRAVNELLDRGLTPIVSMRDGDAVRAPRIQSIAQPPRALPIRRASSAS